MKLLVIVLLLAPYVAFADSEPRRCPPATFAEMNAYLLANGRTRVVLFATWCGPCLAHLQRPDDGETLLVAIFDSPDRVERAVRQLDLTTPCFVGENIAAPLGVKTVPAEFLYQGGIFERLQ